MKIALGIMVVAGLGLMLSACDPNGQASNPNTCLSDGSVSWWVNPNKEGQVKDTASLSNCAKANTAWQAPAAPVK
jgi:hypothetical protein